MRTILVLFGFCILFCFTACDKKQQVSVGDDDVVVVVDDIDLPFVNDPEIIGTWTSIDFVETPDKFSHNEKSWSGDLYLKELVFLENGKTPQNWWTWTKGVLIHSGDKTASKYELKDINGVKYLFLEWKSGDYTIRHQKPWYYVLKKKQ